MINPFEQLDQEISAAKDSCDELIKILSATQEDDFEILKTQEWELDGQNQKL